MKKSSIWKLLFSALTVFAVAVFAGCTDDNDDMGAPYLNVTPENLTFDAEGQPADEYNGTFIVETNRPWRAIVEDEQTWVRLSATEGEGDAAVTVTVPASNIGQSAKVTFEVYNSYGALIQKDVNVLQGEVKPATVIYGNNFDKTLAAKDANNRWPFLDQSDAWQNATGTGIESVTYAYKNMSVRSSQKNSGGYDGASGQNKIFFGTAPANFDIDNITLPSGETNYRITFGANYSKNNDGTYDNTFKPEYFHVWVGNGTTWKELKYEKIGGSDETDPYWILFKSDFTLKTALKELSIRFTTTTGGEAANSAFSIDDLSFTNGNGGQEVDLEGGVVPPDPGEATAITIPELIAQMTTTEAPVDANADRYLDAVVMNDVAGANYTFNNLILATENATEAGNGITLYGSGVYTNPADEGFTFKAGDKVKVTLKAGEARVTTYNKLYEVTGSQGASWVVVEKIGTATVTPVEIAPNQITDFQAMPVSIKNVTAPATASTWNGTKTFTQNGVEVTVYTSQGAPWADQQFVAGATGTITGYAALYKGAAQVSPRNTKDIADFMSGTTPDPDPDVTPIGEITTAGTYKTEGTVVARGKMAYIIADNTGAMMVYHKDNERTVGEKISISGEVTLYNAQSTPQFSDSAVVEVLSTGNNWTYNPAKKDGAAMDALLSGTPVCTEIAFQGNLAISGNYVNVTIPGASTAIGSVKYIDNSTVAAYDGKDVIVKGYFVGTSSGKYVNVLPYSVEEANPSTDPQMTVDPASLSFAAAGGEKSVTVTTRNADGCTIEASSDNAQFEVSVSGTTVKVVAKENTSESKIEGTLTVKLMKAGSAVVTKTVALSQSGKSSSTGDGTTITMTYTDIINGGSDIPTNAYGTQNVNDESTYYKWSFSSLDFAGARVCIASSSDYKGLIQMQGNDSDVAKQGFFGNVTDLGKITKIVVVSVNTRYEPSVNLYLGTDKYPTTNVQAHPSYVKEGNVYTEEYEISGDYGYFRLWNDSVGATYIQSISITYSK